MDSYRPPDIYKLSGLVTRLGDLIQKYELYSHLPTESQQRNTTPDDSIEQKKVKYQLGKSLEVQHLILTELVKAVLYSL